MQNLNTVQIGKEFEKECFSYLITKFDKVIWLSKEKWQSAGEKLSFIEGWISALEWVINDDDLLSKDKTPPTMGKDKKYKRLLDKFLERERKKVRGGSGDDMFYEQQIIDYVGKQEDFLITLIKFVEKELNEGNCKIEKLKREMEDTNKKIRGLL